MDETDDSKSERDREGEGEAVKNNDAPGGEPAPAPGLFRNYVSFAGAAIAAAGFVSIVLMILLEFTSNEGRHNPYVGIFTYVLFPSVMVFGLLVIPVGM